MMKKLLLLTLSLLMVLGLSACSKKEEEPKDLLAEIKERGYITVAT